MKRRGLSLLGILSAVAVGALPAWSMPITVNGTLDAAYGPAVSVQTTQTQFGDANNPNPGDGGSELDAAYAKVNGGRLFLMFTGNQEPNFNKLEVFIDSTTGGENRLSPTPDYDFFNGSQWISTNLNGLTFDAGFAADYHLFARRGGATAPYEVDFINRSGGVSAMVPGAAGAGSAAATSVGSIAAGAVGPNASGSSLTQPLGFAINNSNAAGVMGGTASADQTAAQAVTTGMEFSIALADIGNPGFGDVIRVSAMINNGDHNYLSNQILGGLPHPKETWAVMDPAGLSAT